MMKEEFESRINGQVSNEDYDVIEYVYTWHPFIDPVKGKDQMASLYNMPCGMEFIMKMLPIANKAAKHQQLIDAKRSELARLQGEYETLLDKHRKCEF